ncbi:MAG: putative Ig domain-containing protein, partial [Candidatus Dormibacteria bacterium]
MLEPIESRRMAGTVWAPWIGLDLGFVADQAMFQNLPRGDQSQGSVQGQRIAKASDVRDGGLGSVELVGAGTRTAGGNGHSSQESSEQVASASRDGAGHPTFGDSEDPGLDRGAKRAARSQAPSTGGALPGRGTLPWRPASSASAQGSRKAPSAGNPSSTPLNGVLSGGPAAPGQAGAPIGATHSGQHTAAIGADRTSHQPVAHAGLKGHGEQVSHHAARHGQARRGRSVHAAGPFPHHHHSIHHRHPAPAPTAQPTQTPTAGGSSVQTPIGTSGNTTAPIPISPTSSVHPDSSGSTGGSGGSGSGSGGSGGSVGAVVGSGPTDLPPVSYITGRVYDPNSWLGPTDAEARLILTGVDSATNQTITETADFYGNYEFALTPGYVYSLTANSISYFWINGTYHNISVPANESETLYGYDFYADAPAYFIPNPGQGVYNPAPIYAYVDQPFTYTLYAGDPENSPLDFSLFSGPPGMVVSPHNTTGYFQATDNPNPSIWPGEWVTTGTLNWTPSSSDVGNHSIEVDVSDGWPSGGPNSSLSLNITVLPTNPPNLSPVFTSSPVTSANVGTPYTYQATAVDQDGDPLTYSIGSGPNGMTIDPSTGLVQWTPTVAELGTTSVTLDVSDGRGGSASQTYSILVQPAVGNDAPAIVSKPITSVVAGSTYEYDVRAVDADNDPLTYSLTTDPSGMSINATTGVISWPTTLANVGTYPVTVRVDDGYGYYDTQSYTLAVTTANEIMGRKTVEPAAAPPPPGPTYHPLIPGQVSLVSVSANLSSPNSITYYPPNNSLIVSVNDQGGTQPNFLQLSANATTSPFSSTTGLSATVGAEIDMAVAPANNVGGFTSGDLFVANGQPGQIMRISNNGQTVTSDWTTLPTNVSGGGAGIPHDGITFDTTGLFGGDLIVTDDNGDIWLVNSQGTATALATVSSMLEGIITVPNDPTQYGPLAGKIVATDETRSGIWTIDPLGTTTYYNLGITGPESLRLIPANANFYGVDVQSRVLGAPASDFTNMVGDILLAQESFSTGSGLYVLAWDGNQLVTQPIVLNASSVPVNVWEQMTFAPAPLGPVPDARVGLPDWTITLTNNSTHATISTTTDSNGDYAFYNVPNGTYTVAEVAQSGWTGKSPAGGTYQVVLTGDQVVTGLDFDNQQQGNTAANEVPTWTTTPGTSPAAVVGARFEYDAHATDTDGDVISYDLPVAPAGMAVDPKTGVVVWTPTAGEVGTQKVQLRAEDGRGGIVLQSFEIVVSDVNLSPVFTTKPSNPLYVGSPYVYAARAIDADGDPVSYSFISGPSSLSVNSSTGLVSWTPQATGSYPVTIAAFDGRGGEVEQTFTLTVDPAATNQAPTITSNPGTTIQLGRTYFYQVAASDADDDPLTYTLTTAPSGLTISASGLVSWTPTASQFGPNSVTVQVSDGRGASFSQSFTVTVAAQQTNDPPVITTTSLPEATVGDSYTVGIQGNDPDGDPLSWSLVQGLPGMVIDPSSGVLAWAPTADQVGSHTITVKLDDNQGSTAQQSYILVVQGANSPPTITSNPPLEVGQGVAYSYQVQATDPDGDALSYALTAAPTGMTINATSGLVQWPDPTPVGSNPSVTVQVSDGQGGLATQSFTLSVTSAQPNQAPSITSKPGLAASVGKAYSYAVAASDADGDSPLTYSLTSFPIGMTINTTTGLIQWTPGGTGTPNVTVVAADAQGATGEQSFTINVTNDPGPQITSGPASTSITAGQTYSFPVAASDTDGDSLVYSLTNAPSGMSINTSGVITWATVNADAGNTYGPITVTTADPAGLTASQTFTLTVNADTQAPTINLQATPGSLQVGQTVSLLIAASDNVAVQALTLSVLTPGASQPTMMTIDGHDAATYIVSAVGNYSFTATATDPAGNTASITQTVTATAPPPAPSVTLGASTSGPVIVTAPTQIIGLTTATLTSWTLSYEPVGSSTFTTIATGTSNPPNDDFGTFDPTLLPNGPYVLQLSTTDSSGVNSTSSEQVNVIGRLKLGNSSLSFSDLTVPAPGLPITITRAYSSLDAGRAGAFGYGWRLEEADFNLKVGLADGQFQSDGMFAGYQYDPTTGNGTVVTLTLPGGTPESFEFVPQPIPTDSNYDLFNTGEYYPVFYPLDPDTTDTLTVPQVPLLQMPDDTYVATSDANLDPYNPADPAFGGNGNFTLTTITGTVWSVNASTGLVQTETDRNGNTLTFSYNSTGSGTPQISSITSNVNSNPQNSGPEVKFTWTGNQITQILDPLNHAINYGYDSSGDLTSVTDRDNNVTQFAYTTSSSHLIDHIIDPLGRTVAHFTYGSDGRISGQTDALGNSTSLGYNIGNLSGTVTAPGASNSSSLSFDSLGNVTSATDPTGDKSSATYSGDYLTSQTQTVGSTQMTTQYSYDTHGNVTSVTDPLGNVSSTSYNSFGEPTSTSDAQGNTSTYQYDANGNLLSTTSPSGAVASFTYDSHGEMLTATSAAGTATNTYDQYGNLTSTTTPQGVTTTNTYDALGNLLTSSWTWVDPTNPSNTHVIETENTYDGNGNLVQTSTYDNGMLRSTTSSTYDADGHVISSTDQYGGVTTSVYDADGRLIQTTTPDGLVTDTVYDSQGRVIYTDDPHKPGVPCDGTETTYDQAGRVTETQRLANLVITVSQSNGVWSSAFTSAGAVLSTSTTTYDSAGRAISTTDPAGLVTNNQYDAAGQVTQTSEVVGSTTRTTTSTYNADGQVASTTDAMGNTTQYQYNAAGQVTTTTFADGSTVTDQYNALGQKTAETDQNGNVTQYQYGPFGNLTEVIEPSVTNPVTGNPANPTYRYTYDTYGNMTSMTDALGRTTSYAYDAYGHKLSETLPMGQTETWAYNGLGQMTSFTDFDGNVTDYTYTTTGTPGVAPGQLEQETIYAAGNLSTPYDTITDTYGQGNPNSQGSYTDTVSDSLSGATTSSTYDVNGNLVQITSPQGTINYTYDPATGLETGVSTSNTSIQYGYDQAGELTTVTTSKLDGATLTTNLVTTYGYDLDGGLVSTQNANGTTEAHTYNAVNQLTSIVDKNGSTTIASFSYGHDAAGHVSSETDFSGQTNTYTYDSLGRLTQEVIAFSPTSTRTLTWSYDLVGNRVGSTDSGAPANQQSLAYTYNANDELVSITGSSGWGQTYTYDANGGTLTVAGAGGASSSSTTWTPLGQMATYTSGTTSVSYTYDDAGNRTSETVGGATTTYLNDPNQAYDQVLEEYASGGILAATYVRGIDLLFQDRSGTRSFYVSDNLGSTRALTNSAGTVTDTYTYDAYGNLIGGTQVTTNEFLFTGQQFDGAIGQYFQRARYYDAAGGRFTSRDSYDGQTADPITENHFVYAGADPLNNSDPTGHDFTLASLGMTMSIGAGLGGAIGGIDAALGGADWRGIGLGVAIGAASGAALAGAAWYLPGLFTSSLFQYGGALLTLSGINDSLQN